MRYIVLFLLVFVLCGCASEPNFRGRLTPDSSAYEVESISQQAKSEVRAFPSEFIVPATDAKATLERAIFFFKTYTSATIPAGLTPTLARIVLTNEGNKRDKFWCQVSRRLLTTGFKYSVFCESRGVKADADLLGRNVARFIKDGQLEAQLLQ